VAMAAMAAAASRRGSQASHGAVDVLGRRLFAQPLHHCTSHRLWLRRACDTEEDRKELNTAWCA